MLDKNAKFLDLNPVHWRRLTDLAYGGPEARKLYLVHDGGKPERLFDSEKGDLPLPAGTVDDAKAWANRLAAENPDVFEVQVVDTATVRDQLSKIQSDPHQDWDSDEFALHAWRERANAPGLAIAPVRDFLWHGVPMARLKKFVDLILPPSCTYVLAVFDETGVWASLLVQFEDKKIVQVGTFDALPKDEMEGINGRDQHPYILSLVANIFRRPTFGWFVGREDFTAYMGAKDVEAKDEIFQRALLEKRATFDYSILIEKSMTQLSPINPGPAATQGK